MPATPRPLSFLLYDGDFDRPFLEKVATDLDHYEREVMDGTPGLWGNRPDQSADFGSFMPYEAGGTTDNLDPMTSLMSAMENDPEYALEFFSDDSHDEGDPHRSYYYIHDRSWDQDGYNAISGVLDVATTNSDLIAHPRSEQAQQAAKLASRTIEYFSERDNIDDLAERIDWPGNGTSENLAHILGTYMSGVDEALSPGAVDDVTPGVLSPDSDAFNGTLANVPSFDRESLTKFSLLAMATDDGFAELRNGLNEYRGGKLGALADSFAAEQSDSNRRQLTAGLGEDANMEGFFMRVIGDDDIREGAEIDARNQAWIDFGSEVVDLIPLPAVDNMAEGITKEVVNAAIDRGKGTGNDAITEALTGNEDDAKDTSCTKADEVLRQQLYTVGSMLADRGLATDPDLEVPSWDEYQSLTPQEQQDIMTSLRREENGVGGAFDFSAYEAQFKSEFFSYFP